MKSRRLRYIGYVECIGKKINKCNIQVERRKKRDTQTTRM
jgi:hypothetical protein